jgi:hypothetical protein
MIDFSPMRPRTPRRGTLHAAWKMDQKLDWRVDVSLSKFFGAKVLHDGRGAADPASVPLAHPAPSCLT